MARGWESKSVEAQIDAAESQRGNTLSRKVVNAGHLELVRRKEGLLLSRTRVVHELETAHNPRYRAQLGKALADLETQINALENS